MKKNDFPNKMHEKIQMYSNQQYLDGYIQNEFLTKDGDADIFYHIDDEEDIFESHSRGEQLSLNWELYDFLEEKTSMLESDIPIHLHICGAPISTKNQEKIRHIFKEHYAIELYKVQRKYERCRNRIIKLFCVGASFILAYAMLYLFTDFRFFMEVCGFLFSFSLWEAFDAMIYAFHDIKIEREGITQNLLTHIDFEEEVDHSEEVEVKVEEKTDSSNEIPISEDFDLI